MYFWAKQRIQKKKKKGRAFISFIGPLEWLRKSNKKVTPLVGHKFVIASHAVCSQKNDNHNKNISHASVRTTVHVHSTLWANSSHWWLQHDTCWWSCSSIKASCSRSFSIISCSCLFLCSFSSFACWKERHKLDLGPVWTRRMLVDW